MEYGTGGDDGDAGTGAATLLSTNGVVALGEDGASAITGVDRAVAIVDVASVDLATLRNVSAGMLLLGAADASRLRATLIGSDVARVEGGGAARSARGGFDERFAIDASGVCSGRRAIVESAWRMMATGADDATSGVAVRLAETDAAVSTP